MPSVNLRIDGDIAVITIDNPPVNALSMALGNMLLAAIETAARDPNVRGAVLIGAGTTFVAGADIREISTRQDGVHGRAPFDAIEAFEKPVVAALHGVALGAGLELALAAHYRVALPSVRVGLPEVLIGLLPGAGGTQRLPRLVGIDLALDLITSGQLLEAKDALRCGILDQLISGSDYDSLLRGALEFVRLRISNSTSLLAVRDLEITGFALSRFTQYRAAHEGKWRGLLAQWKVVDCIEAACTKPWDTGYALEARCFRECAESPQFSALSYLFFAERYAAKPRTVSPEATPREIFYAGVIGAGTMGTGIAMALANAGIRVRILETGSAELDRGLTQIRKSYCTAVSRGSLTSSQALEAVSRVSGTLDYEDLRESDIVIEAVIEDPEVKKSVFRQLDQILKPGAILATNTSTLDVDEIAAATERPDAVVGAHFFAPANVMRLLECVKGADTSPQTLATILRFAKRLNKVAVVAGNCRGFIGNRILEAYGSEADYLLLEGATPWQVDTALKTFGFPMGLYRMRDMVGLDVARQARRQRRSDQNARFPFSQVEDQICEMGRFGRKTGAGYYRYDGRRATPDAEIELLIQKTSRMLDVRRKLITDDEIVNRLLTAMVNEGAAIVGEGYAARTSDIDIVYVYGYGFPGYKGGPMYWAERYGLRKIYDAVLKHRGKSAPLLARAAERGSWTGAEDS